jgi:hypothetical protein
MTSIANILINPYLVENLNQNFDIIGNSINTNLIKNFNQTPLIELDTKINVEADILPTSNNNINLGSSLNEFKNIYGQISSGTQSNISSLPGLLSVQNQSVAPSSWQYLNTMNQSVSTTSNVDFGQLEAKGRLQVLNSSDAIIMDVNTTTPQVTINCDTLINGNITYNTITELKTVDPMIALADGNLTNSLDIGFYGEYATDGKTPIYTGIYRDHTNSRWTFYDNLATAPGSTVGTSYTLSSLKANSYFASYGFSMINEPNTGLVQQVPAELLISVTGSGITKFEPTRMTVLGDCKSTTFSIGATSLNSTSWGYLSAINQNLGTTNNVSFRNITPQTTAAYDLGSTGALWNNLYVNNIYGTIAASAGSQINILEVGSLSRVGAITGYTSGIWQFVRDMQDVKTTATPTFSTLTLQPVTPSSANRLAIRSGASGNFSSLSVGRTSDDSLFAIASGTTGAASGNYFTGSLGGDLCIRSENTGNIMLGFSSTALPVLTLAYTGNIIMTNGAVQVNNILKAHNFRGGVVAEDNTHIINIGINEDSAARFGGSYVPGFQGGMLRLDTRHGQPLFSFLTRAAGSTGAVSSVLNIPATVSTTTGTTLGIDASNNLIRISSSARYKKNIVESKVDSSKIFDLDIREFDYKDTDAHDVGLIAEEVEKILPELVIYGKDSEGAERPDSVKYDRLSLLLLEEVKKIKNSIDSVNALIESLDVRLLALETP